MSKIYNATIAALYAPRGRNGEVGIEVEVEGKKLVQGPIAPYWDHHQDGSLRGEENAEYVLRIPIPRREVRDALDQLFGTLKFNGAKLRDGSPNTSVHVHLNMQDWTLKKVYNLCCLWYILEHPLMDWCGEERKGNHFCLRGSDAEMQLQRLATAVRYGRAADLNDQEGLRYSAMNYTALGKFGSLEFRGFPGIYDAEMIDIWVKMLLSLKDYANKFDSPPDLIQDFSRKGPEDFLKAVLPDLWKKLDLSKDYRGQLREGMRMIQNVAYAVAWEDDKKKRPLKRK